MMLTAGEKSHPRIALDSGHYHVAKQHVSPSPDSASR